MEEIPVPVEEQEESDRGEVNSDISIGHLDEFGDQGGGHEPEADDIDSIAERADDVESSQCWSCQTINGG